jgi:protein disulfide isomerase
MLRLADRAVVLSCLLLGLHAASKNAEVLTDENFHAQIKGDTWIVDFFAPWCGHCKRLAPEMDKLVPMVDGIAKVGTVDATANKGVANAFDVHGYPTLKLFQNDGKTVTDYKGPRDAEGLQRFIKKMESPPVEIISSQEQLEAYAKVQATGFVLLSTASKGLTTMFTNLATVRQADVYFAITEVPFSGIQGDEVNEAKDAVVALADGEVRAVLPSENGEDGLGDFVEHNYLPPCPELTMGSFYDFVNSGKNAVVVLVDPAKEESASEFKQWICGAAKKNLQYRFGWMDAEQHSNFVTSLSVTAEDTPILAVLDAPAKLHYVHRNASLTREQFLVAVQAGDVPTEGEGASWWHWVKTNALAIMVAGFIGVVAFLIWLGDPADYPPPPPNTKRD